MKRMKSSLITISFARSFPTSERGTSSTSSVSSSVLSLSSPGLTNMLLTSSGDESWSSALRELLECFPDPESLKTIEESKVSLRSCSVWVALRSRRSRVSCLSRSRSRSNCMLSTPDVIAAIDWLGTLDEESSESLLQVGRSVCFNQHSIYLRVITWTHRNLLHARRKVSTRSSSGDNG